MQENPEKSPKANPELPKEPQKGDPHKDVENVPTKGDKGRVIR